MKLNLSVLLGLLLAASILFCSPKPTQAADWPMWRNDAGHGAYTPDALPKQLFLQWTRKLPKPQTAWPATQKKLQFDDSYAPVVGKHTLFVGSTIDDSVTAYHTADGRQLWQYFTNGPVRFAPVYTAGNVYVVSDDGYLYCLNAETGTLNWKVNGGPADRKLIGNRRLISTWPARGGPVLADGVIYFAAGIWPSMGIFIHAVDAVTGDIIWTNSKTGSLYIVHPHGAPSFGSVVPQGTLTVSGDNLIVPGGRSTPAVLNRKTGKMKYFRFDKRTGHFRVLSRGSFYFLAGTRYDLTDGGSLGDGAPEILTNNSAIALSGKKIVSSDLKGTLKRTISRDRKGRVRILKKFSTKTHWTISASDGSPVKPFLQAGQRIYTAGSGRIAAFELPTKKRKSDSQPAAWSQIITGDVRSMIAADDRLFVVTDDGTLHCFGATKTAVRHHSLKKSTARNTSNEKSALLAATIIKITGAEKRPVVVKKGLSPAEPAYAILFGIGKENSLSMNLAEMSNHRVIAVEPQQENVTRFRLLANQQGQYGSAAAHQGTLESFPLPPYLASLIVVENLKAAGISLTETSARKLFHPLRPYGGVACLRLTAEQHREFKMAVEKAGLANAVVTRKGDWSLLRRVGALPKSASWSHQYGDGSNSVVSRDLLVKAPLGVLWFGGPPNDKILPRHGHGPSPQVAGGRLFIEGPDIMRAVDVYTGRLIWETELKGLGKFYDVTSHFPGAGEIGSNYVSQPDAVYIVYGNQLLELDSATGQLKKEFSLGVKPGKKQPHWGHISVEGDLLIATSSPVAVNTSESKGKPVPAEGIFQPVPYSSASRRIVVFNRKTAKLLWSRDAQYNFRHNCIVAAEGKVFCIDGLSPTKIDALKRRGVNAEGRARLFALDAQSGRVIWSKTKNVTGTFLNYSRKHDVLLQAGSAYRDRAKDEVSRGMTTYQGKDGKVIWTDPKMSYNGPCLLWRDKIITNGAGGFQLELLTGKKTGWTYSRMYGCNTAVGSEHLLTFRSGAAGFCDLTGDSGTGNIGGFRSSCTANLIAADGVLNAPDYTRTCSCAYQNQTSLALIHMPGNEFWTFNRRSLEKGLSQRFGLNLGAPGDRRSKEGSLFLDYPSVGGPSPEIKVSVAPKTINWFHAHSSVMKGTGLEWVGSTGGEGVTNISITANSSVPSGKSCTVRLYFSEPTTALPGERLFSVAIQGKTVLNRLDVVKAAGGSRRTIVREFKNITIGKELSISLTPAKSSKRPPVLSGVEVIQSQK